MSLFGQVVDATTGEVLREATRGDWARAREARRLGVDGLVRVRTVDAYAVEWTKTPVRLELTIRRDALVGKVVP